MRPPTTSGEDSALAGRLRFQSTLPSLARTASACGGSRLTASKLPRQKAGEEALSDPRSFFQRTLPVSLLSEMKTPSLSIMYIRSPTTIGANSISWSWSYFQSLRNGGRTFCALRNLVRAGHSRSAASRCCGPRERLLLAARSPVEKVASGLEMSARALDEGDGREHAGRENHARGDQQQEPLGAVRRPPDACNPLHLLRSHATAATSWNLQANAPSLQHAEPRSCPRRCSTRSPTRRPTWSAERSGTS